MYQIPSEELVDSCTITKEVVDGQGEPVLTYGGKSACETGHRTESGTEKQR